MYVLHSVYYVFNSVSRSDYRFLHFRPLPSFLVPLLFVFCLSVLSFGTNGFADHGRGSPEARQTMPPWSHFYDSSLLFVFCLSALAFETNGFADHGRGSPKRGKRSLRGRISMNLCPLSPRSLNSSGTVAHIHLTLHGPDNMVCCAWQGVRASAPGEVRCFTGRRARVV